MTGTWGLSRNLQAVHYFDKDGKSLCTDDKRQHRTLRYARPDWQPEYPRTCRDCKKLKEITEIEEKGKKMQLKLISESSKSSIS